MLPREATPTNYNKGIPTNSNHTLGNQSTHPSCRHTHIPQIAPPTCSKSYQGLRQRIGMLQRAAKPKKYKKGVLYYFKHTLGNQSTHSTCTHAHMSTQHLCTYNMQQQQARTTAKDWYPHKGSHMNEPPQSGTLQLQITPCATREHIKLMNTPTSTHSTSAHTICSNR